MKMHHVAKLLRIYLGESDKHAGRPLYELIVEEARSRGLAGATAVRGVLGFGASSHVHTAKLLRLSEDLPMVVEIVDTAERIEAFLPLLEKMVSKGLVTLEPVEAIFHMPMRVRDVMTSEVLSVGPDAPLSSVLALLLSRKIKALPVVQGRKILGIITGGDLLMRAGMGLRLSLQHDLPKDALAEQARKLDSQGKRACDIMTSPVQTINIMAKVPEAARTMASKQLKRLPVVDDHGDLAGIISRVDVLKTVAHVAAGLGPLPDLLPPCLRCTVADIIFRDVPVTGPERPLGEVLDMIVSTPLRRVVVVDEQRRVLGIVLDRDLVSRFGREEQPGRLRSLLRRLSAGPAESEAWQGTAGDVMHRDVFTLPETTPVPQALDFLVRNKVKRVVVTDEQGRLVGMIDRDSLLRLLAQGLEASPSKQLKQS
ncbi:DUF190 domain-containing protein [Desulfocurvibacter africanus]|uniref:CBS domain-containing protein n=1 Tax=Desulfocurvibacter africanus subsp. africanus str. Walvis Bay TaxID=690850 RepID=F3YYQ1_DESAF|nr:DUF190 domain-containing protein [Desulfocurvibacter africanus]EGJ51877.1 protein of unknown function DUF190 [Desulfocurvibacter africanus subsp. africanus str. Walvis Bay]